jgi:hypothetical protein
VVFICPNKLLDLTIKHSDFQKFIIRVSSLDLIYATILEIEFH